MKKLIVVGLSLVMGSVLMANDVDLGQAFGECMDASGGVTAAMIGCISAETRRQDMRLNHAYKTLMADLPPIRQEELKKAQRLWLSYREANCAFYADPDGGSIARVNANDCFMSMTALRATELENLKPE